MIIFLFLLQGALSQAEPWWFDNSHQIFFSHEIEQTSRPFRAFPLYWWNFVVIDPTAEQKPNYSLSTEVCRSLAKWPIELVRSLPCSGNLTNYRPLLLDWLRDSPWRQDFPANEEFKKKWQATLSKASLPLGREALTWLQLDPLDQLKDWLSRLAGRSHFKGLAENQGLLVETRSGTVLLPFQLNFPPEHSRSTALIAKSIAELNLSQSVHLLGPHAGTLENESQIRQDVDTVSRVGSLGLIVLILFIVGSGRFRLLNLIPLLTFSMLLAAILTIAIFGKIHGLTLAFGPGLVGLAMDYGIHAAFLQPKSRQTWRSNQVGIWTTLVILILLSLSSVPLLRQMMVFAIIGLNLSFWLFYWSMAKRPQWFGVKPFNFEPEPRPLWQGMACLLVLAAALFGLLPRQLTLQSLNFESAATQRIHQWFIKASPPTIPVAIPEDTSLALESAHLHLDWAQQRQMDYQGLAAEFPLPPVQAAHLISWQNQYCQNNQWDHDLQAIKFFRPFTELIDCSSHKIRSFTAVDDDIPKYLADFHSPSGWMSVIFPRYEQLAQVKAQFPQSYSPLDLLDSVPKALASEFTWMVPLSFIGALLILWFYYRRITFALTATLPFFSGLGCYVLMNMILRLPLNFISYMGLLMVFGFSLDYGVFVMDYLNSAQRDRRGVWTALAMSATVTIIGFIPMIAAEHPVLKSLGHALLWGSLGTLIGAFWGVPLVFYYLKHHQRIRAWT